MNILLWGACGRMGKNVAELVSEPHQIVCGVDLFPAPMPFPVYANAGEIKESPEVIIDFSSAQNLSERLNYCSDHKLPIVLAATGYTAQDETLIKNAAQKIAIFKTGNLSLGINLLQLLVKKTAEILGDGFDAEIIERHHNQKKDAPSGTAIMLAESINEGFGNNKKNIYGRHGLVGARGKNEIGIHAVRGGTIVGEHEVCFAGEDEIITISHSARSRKVFAAGALKAAAWLIKQPAGLYNMHDFFSQLI